MHQPFQTDVEAFSFIVGSTNAAGNGSNDTLTPLTLLEANSTNHHVPWKESVKTANTEFGDYDFGLVGLPPLWAPSGEALFQSSWSDNRNEDEYSSAFNVSFATK